MAINPNLVGVPAQSKNLDTATTTTTAGLVHRQVISIADPETATSYARVSGGNLQVSVQNATLAVTQSGTFNITNISGTVSLPTGASTATLQTTGNTSLNSIDTKTPALSGGRVPVESNLVQGLTDTQLRASAVPVSGTFWQSTQPVSGTFWQSTQPVSAVSLPLPTDASTSALQTTGNSSLSSIDAKTPSLSSGRVPVESNLVQGLTDTQLRASAVPVSAASLPLPTGAATESTLAALNNKFNTNSFSNINTNTTSTVKSGAGVLKRIVVNKVGALSNTCTIYDNTTATGTIIGTIDPVHTQMVFEYDLAFSIGLTIVTANGTAADITVIYK
jgi:hypothetical protein